MNTILILTAEVSGLRAFLQENYLDTLALFPMLTLLLLLAFIVPINSHIRPDLKRNMELIVAVVFSLVVQNYLEYRLAAGETRWLARTLTAVYGYAIRPVILLLFMKVIAPQRRFGWAWALVGVNTAVNLTALFSHVCFWISEDNHWQPGPLSKTCLTVSVIFLVCLFVMTIRVFKPQERRETWLPVLVFVLIAGSIVLDSHVGLLPQPVSYLTIAAVIDCVCYYFWLHMQFVRAHEQALQAEQRIQIMKTQIQPHFLYNTLSTIQALCTLDPEKAAAVTGTFSRYLRQNLDSLDEPGRITFEKEMEHTRLYVDIEQIRFPNIRVEYAIEDGGFLLPPLTVQPIVENAIRHGVRIREEGIVRVSAHRTGEEHAIVIEDNGCGFDAQAPAAGDDKHIGLKNVRERIETMCGGSVTVESRIGEGTTITIRIPARENEEKA